MTRTTDRVRRHQSVTVTLCRRGPTVVRVRQTAHVSEFEAELWLWDAKGEESAWVFATLPKDLSDDLRETAPPRGFGSVRVEVTIGETTWRTSVFPDKDSGCFVLPVKKAVRTAEQLDIGDKASFSLRSLDEAF